MLVDNVFLGYGNLVNLLEKKLSCENQLNLIISEQKFNFKNLCRNTRVIKRSELFNLQIITKNLINSWNNFDIIRNNDALKTYFKSSKIEFENIINLGSASIYKNKNYAHDELDAVIESHDKVLYENFFTIVANLKDSKILNLRLSNIYGEYMKNSFINKIINYQKLGKSVPVFSNISIKRDYILDEDVVNIILKLMKSPQKPTLLNISSSIGVSFQDIIDKFSKLKIPLEIELVATPPNLRTVSILNNNLLKRIIKVKINTLDEYLDLILK